MSKEVLLTAGDVAKPRLYLRGRIWWTWYYERDGKVRQVSTRCRDRTAAESTARRLETEVYGEAGPTELEWFRGPFENYVYFIQQGTDGPIKIGRSRRVEFRLARLQCGSPQKLNILCAIPGGSRLECVLHAAFGDDWVIGEWFEPTKELLALVSELRRAWGRDG